jgi:hypothetical protein
MSGHATPATSSVPYDGYEEEDRGLGWVIVAGALLLLLGTECDRGSRRDRQHALLRPHHKLHLRESQHLGLWVVLCIGLLELLVGLGVFVKNLKNHQFARRTDVVVLAANAIAQLLMMPAYPFWSLTIFAIDIVAIYGLIAVRQANR